MSRFDDDDKFRIFISHKHTDGDLARQTKMALEGLSGEHPIECFVSGADIPAGSDWNDVLREALTRSHMLLLLFTNPSRNWDWCLFEAGLFTRFDQRQPRSVVCIYDPEGTPPAPLKNLQGIPARADKIGTFLKRLCRSTWEVAEDWRRGPLRPDVSEEQVNLAATAMCSKFQHATGYYPCHRIVLNMNGIDDIDDKIPEQAQVIEGQAATTAFTLSLFGMAEGPKKRTWGDLLDSIDGHESDWRQQLDNAFAKALREQLFDPVSAPLHAWDGKRSYRPMLYRILRARGVSPDTAEQLPKQSGRHPKRGIPVELTIVLEGVRSD